MKWFAAATFVLFLFAGNAGASVADSPQALVRQTSEQMLAALKNNHEAISKDPGKLYGLIKDIVLPHFDFQRMSRWALGRAWRQASPAQRKRFVGEFRTLLVRTYGSALEQYRDQKIQYLPVRMDPGATHVSVRTEVQRSGGPPIPINYGMEKTADGWKVFDVTVDGISLVSSYRSTFTSAVRSHGIDGLIDMLAKRNHKADS
ncbi:MAG TPA: ABC transporter substrate-binding protein [Gammaproteobacteria bacterium]|nr:ABC transporter substrate-binding protein [Gammaproteobacteria bacterium]